MVMVMAVRCGEEGSRGRGYPAVQEGRPLDSEQGADLHEGGVVGQVPGRARKAGY